MPFEQPRPGAAAGIEYLVSAIPWVTSSTSTSGITQIDFKYVTKFINIRNNSVTGSATLLGVGFTQNGILKTNNFFTLTPGESWREEIRIRTLFLSGNNVPYTVCAGLTMIDAKYFPVLSSSMSGSANGFGGVG